MSAWTDGIGAAANLIMAFCAAKAYFLAENELERWRTQRRETSLDELATDIINKGNLAKAEFMDAIFISANSLGKFLFPEELVPSISAMPESFDEAFRRAEKSYSVLLRTLNLGRIHWGGCYSDKEERLRAAHVDLLLHLMLSRGTLLEKEGDPKKRMSAYKANQDQVKEIVQEFPAAMEDLLNAIGNDRLIGKSRNQREYP